VKPIKVFSDRAGLMRALKIDDEKLLTDDDSYAGPAIAGNSSLKFIPSGLEV
jgi:hypothetical protein